MECCEGLMCDIMREVLKEWDVAHERSLSLPRKKRNCRNSVSHSAGEHPSSTDSDQTALTTQQ